MNNFEFFNNTRIVFGQGEVNKIGSFAKAFGKKAILVTSRGGAQRHGIFDKVKKSLCESGVQSVDLIGVNPNPRLETVISGVQLCKQHNADMIVAVGGGSVIDCVKAIAFCRYDNGNAWDFFTGKRKPKKVLPILTVLTLSGTGSEMNSNCVITNMQLGQKYVTNVPEASPKVSIIDPQLMTSVPENLTAFGMVDTITHVLEKYFDGTTNTPMQDRIAEGVIHTVIENEYVLGSPDDVDARGNLAWASTIALNNIANAGRGFGAFDAHTIELEISAKYDVAHGAGLAVVFPAWMRHLCGKNPEKFVQFAERIFDIKRDGKSDFDIGMLGIKALTAKFKDWGMPESLEDLGACEKDIKIFAKGAIAAPNGKSLHYDEVCKVLRDCLKKKAS